MRPILPALRRLLALTPLMLCAACALFDREQPAPPMLTKIQVEKVAIPAPLLDCKPDPDIPETVMGDQELAHLLVDLWAAGDDCRGKLRDVKRIAGQNPSD